MPALMCKRGIGMACLSHAVLLSLRCTIDGHLDGHLGQVVKHFSQLL